MTVEGSSEVVALGFGSRAGAAALAAPAEVNREDPVLDGALVSGSRNVAPGSVSAAGAAFAKAIDAGDAIDGEGAGLGVVTDSFDSPESVIALVADALMLVCGVCVGAGMCAGANGVAAAIGRTAEARGITGAGAGGVGFAVVAVPGFAASPLRNSPLATRSVPFACSTLIGLVRTRFAPMRKALATPACPSTTATARED